MLKQFDYIVWKENKHYVSQCINVDIASFGDTIDEAIDNLQEAVELYFEDEKIDIPQVDRIFLGKGNVNV